MCDFSRGDIVFVENPMQTPHYTLLATTVVRFQEELYVHIVGSLIGDVDGAETGRSSGCVLQKRQKMPALAKQIIFSKNPYLKYFGWLGME